MEVKIWGIVQGPISIEDVDDSELDDAPPDSKYFMVCKSEIDGVMGEDNFWFEELEDAYELQKHFSKNIDPILETFGDNSDVIAELVKASLYDIDDIIVKECEVRYDKPR